MLDHLIWGDDSVTPLVPVMVERSLEDTAAAFSTLWSVQFGAMHCEVLADQISNETDKWPACVPHYTGPLQGPSGDYRNSWIQKIVFVQDTFPVVNIY